MGNNSSLSPVESSIASKQKLPSHYKNQNKTKPKPNTNKTGLSSFFNKTHKILKFLSQLTSTTLNVYYPAALIQPIAGLKYHSLTALCCATITVCQCFSLDIR